MSKTGFKELKVWQDAKDIAVNIYKMTSMGELSKDFSLRDQMRRAAVSIASNIAEGNDRETNKEFIRFLYVAKASSAELTTQLEIAKEIGYIDLDILEEMESKLLKNSNMIGALIKTLNKSNP